LSSVLNINLGCFEYSCKPDRDLEVTLESRPRLKLDALYETTIGLSNCLRDAYLTGCTSWKITTCTTIREGDRNARDFVKWIDTSCDRFVTLERLDCYYFAVPRGFVVNLDRSFIYYSNGHGQLQYLQDVGPTEVRSISEYRTLTVHDGSI